MFQRYLVLYLFLAHICIKWFLYFFLMWLQVILNCTNFFQGICFQGGGVHRFSWKKKFMKVLLNTLDIKRSPMREGKQMTWATWLSKDIVKRKSQAGSKDGESRKTPKHQPELRRETLDSGVHRPQYRRGKTSQTYGGLSSSTELSTNLYMHVGNHERLRTETPERIKWNNFQFLKHQVDNIEWLCLRSEREKSALRWIL